MNKKLFYIFMILLLSSPVLASDYYISQTAAGSEDGSSCVNADAIADLTWGSGNMIDAGDTLHLCGTITNTIIPGASGTSGSEITIKFEDDAKLSTAAWGLASDAAIYGNGKNYIIVDGGTNGIIENTDNGTNGGTQQESNGIYITGCDNWEIKNLTIQNIYERTADSDDSNRYGESILAKSCSDLSIHDNTITQAEYLLFMTAYTAATNNLDIYNNTLSRGATAIVVSISGNYNYSDIEIYDNTITEIYYWDGEWNSGTSWHHADGIHTWAGGGITAYTIGTIKIHGNYFGDDFGDHCSGWIYLTDYTYPAEIYNNVFVNAAEKPGLGYMAINSDAGSNQSAKIYNNTVIGPSSGNTGGIGVYSTKGFDLDVSNNIFKTVYVGYADSVGSAGWTAETNCYYDVGNVAHIISDWDTLSEWQTRLGGCPNDDNDCDAIETDPGLNASYKPDDATDNVVDAGTSLSGTFTDDKDGIARPQGNGWDIGAYEYEGVATPPSTSDIPFIRTDGTPCTIGTVPALQ